MKIITSFLMGGLGNQLFQIAMAYTLARKLNYSLVFDRNQFGMRGQGHPHSVYHSNIFRKITFIDNFPKIDLQVCEITWCPYNIIQQLNRLTSGLVAKPDCIRLRGYFQSELNWGPYAKEIKQLFTPDEGIIPYLKNNTNILNRYPELETANDFVFLAIRRGDYMKVTKTHNPCGIRYYSRAIQKMGKKRYYISSDDMEWCKKNFVGEKFIHMDFKKDHNALLTMALFKNYIISNSTFHWWGSFLSIYSDAKIIAPDKWINLHPKKKIPCGTIYRKNMTVLARSGWVGDVYEQPLEN